MKKELWATQVTGCHVREDGQVVVSLGSGKTASIWYPPREHDGGGSFCMCGTCILVRYQMQSAKIK